MLHSKMGLEGQQQEEHQVRDAKRTTISGAQ